MPDIIDPTVHLVSPLNNTNVTNGTQTFFCNITDNRWTANLTLYIWNSSGDVNYTNTTNLTGTSNSTNWTYTLPYDDSFLWNCLGYDAAGNYNWSSEGNYTITLDRIAPVVSLISPANNTIIVRSNQIFTCNISDNYWTTNLTFFVWDSSNTSIYNSTANVSGPFNETSFSYTLPDYGTFNWNCLGYDALGNKNWSNTGNYTVIFSNDVVSIDFTGPTPINNTNTTNTSFVINISIWNESSLDAFVWMWDEVNYTLYDDSLVLMSNLDNENTEPCVVNEVPEKPLTMSIPAAGKWAYNLGRNASYEAAKRGDLGIIIKIGGRNRVGVAALVRKVEREGAA